MNYMKRQEAGLTQQQETLLAAALQLWACTMLITSSNNPLSISVNPHHAAAGSPLPLRSREHSQGDLRNIDIDTSRQVITKQLDSAAEHRCKVLSKRILTELEQRLIDRKQSNRLELFLTSFLVLISAERICHFFRAFETRGEPLPTDPATPAATGCAIGANIDPLLGSGSNTAPNPHVAEHNYWPLEKTPEYFWQQGDKFSDLLASMMRMRNVPPRTIPIESNGRTVLVAQPEEDDLIKAYISAIDLTGEDLKRVAEKSYDTDDKGCWELKWASKLFNCMGRAWVNHGNLT